MRRSTAAATLAAVLLAVPLLSGCGQDSDAEGDADRPDSLRMGVPPGEADPAFLDQFQAVADLVEEGAGVPVEVTQTSDYLAIVEAMRSDLLDIAAFSPFPTVLAESVAGVQPLVAATGAPYSSYVVCRADTGITELSEIAGHTLALVDPGSTSGNYIPRLMLQRAGVDVDEDTDVTFAGGHDVSMLAVQQGSTDCGAVASMIWASMTEEGVIDADDFTIVAESEPLPISLVIIARAGLDEALLDAVTDAFVDSQDQAALDVIGATAFVDADDADFTLFEDAAQELGVDLEDVE